MDTDKKPILAITLGDAAGSGPELITRALTDPAVRDVCRAVVVGDAAVLREAAGITECRAEIRVVESPAEAGDSMDRIDVLDLANVDLKALRRGTVSSMTGKAAYEAIERSVQLALKGEVDAIVTSAIHKKSLNDAGYRFDGHTEILAHLCKAPKVTMMLVSDKLRICHVSTHCSLREAIERVKPDRIVDVIGLAREGALGLGVKDPHVAVAGLNPHAGEGGLFGDEEEKYITPAIEQARARGWRVSGPYAGDTIFFRAHAGHFDAAVAMYHDQGHAAAKMLGIWRGVNVTLGLPIIRTSVEHGTDFDNAGKGTSDPRSLIQAIQLASVMVSNRGARAAV